MAYVSQNDPCHGSQCWGGDGKKIAGPGTIILEETCFLSQSHKITLNRTGELNHGMCKFGVFKLLTLEFE